MKGLLEFIKSAGSGSESDHERNGAFSTAAESHAFINGLSDGTKSWRLAPKEIPLDNPDIVKEPHYYKGGYFLGTILQLCVFLVLFIVADVPLPM